MSRCHAKMAGSSAVGIPERTARPPLIHSATERRRRGLAVRCLHDGRMEQPIASDFRRSVVGQRWVRTVEDAVHGAHRLCPAVHTDPNESGYASQRVPGSIRGSRFRHHADAEPNSGIGIDGLLTILQACATLPCGFGIGGDPMIRQFGKMIGAGIIALAATIGLNAAAQAQQPSTWNAIQERDTLRIGVTQAPPWYFFNPATGAWSGLGISIGSAMAETLGVDVAFVEVTWGTAVSALQADQIDIMFVLDATPARAMAVDFPPQPLLYYALAVLADDDLTIETWDDLNQPGIKIAVTQGTTMDSYVSARLTQTEILRFPSNGEAVAAFQSRRVNAVSLFHPPLIAMRQRIGRGQIVLPEPIRQSASSAGVRRDGDGRWRDWVNTAISYYYQTGQTQVWYEEFLIEFGVDPASVPAIRRENW